MNNLLLDKLPKLSIIIPNYNYGNYIEETILSVINQNYPNTELIIIDGGSTDDSIEIIKKYNKHINYWISEKDNGQADAINRGLKVATGDYVAFMNSDDTYLDNAFVNIFNNKKSVDKDFIYGDVMIGKSILESKPNKNKNNFLEISSLILFYYSASYIIPSQSVFVKRDFLLKNRLNFLNENLHYCMDLDWYCRISQYNPTIYKYPKINAFFRINDSTKTVSQSSKMKKEALEIAFLYLKDLSEIDFKIFYLNRLIYLVLNKIYQKKINPNLLMLIRLIFKTNFIALENRKFLGVLKNQILFK